MNVVNFLEEIEYSIIHHKSLNSININEQERRLLHNYISDCIDKIDKILSYGSKWNPDEILWIFTLQLHIKIIELLFDCKKIKLEINLYDVEEKIKLIRKQNKKSYDIAKVTLLRNNSLPQYLIEDTIH